MPRRRAESQVRGHRSRRSRAGRRKRVQVLFWRLVRRHWVSVGERVAEVLQASGEPAQLIKERIAKKRSTLATAKAEGHFVTPGLIDHILGGIERLEAELRASSSAQHDDV